MAQGVGGSAGGPAASGCPSPAQHDGGQNARGLGQRNAGELSYLGDAVFELMVREMLLAEAGGAGLQIGTLHQRAKSYVSAPAQAAMYHKIFPQLTPEEQAAAKRGRNLHSTSRAKNAAATDYRHATGLEALFGYLHLQGDTARMREIFDLCVSKMTIA